MLFRSDQVMAVLNESFAELSRAEISARTGLDREKVRKVLHLLIKEGKVSRRIDENGIEWLDVGDGVAGVVVEETKPVIEEGNKFNAAHQERLTEVYQAAYKKGTHDTYIRIGLLIAGWFQNLDEGANQ